MIYLASLGEAVASREFSNSFLHHLYSRHSKLQRAGNECQQSLYGLLLPSYISCLCFSQALLRSHILKYYIDLAFQKEDHLYRYCR